MAEEVKLDGTTVAALLVVALVAGAGAYAAAVFIGPGAAGSPESQGNSTSSTTTTYTPSLSTTAQQLPVGTVSISAATALLKAPLSGATVDRNSDRITFAGSSVRIAAFALMPENATALTGMQPPAYSTDDVFVIGGLINPTLVIPRGATVNLTVVNLDDDMYHDMVFSGSAPPYPYMAMNGMMWGASGGFLYMMPILSPADYGAGWAPAYSYTVTVPNLASLWYFCTYPGHAQSGMYGEVLTY